jgi:hypothetical protein
MSKGLGRNTRFKQKNKKVVSKGKKSYMGGGATEVGKQAQSYKEYVKKTFGGGKT